MKLNKSYFFGLLNNKERGELKKMISPRKKGETVHVMWTGDGAGRLFLHPLKDGAIIGAIMLDRAPSNPQGVRGLKLALKRARLEIALLKEGQGRSFSIA